MRMKSTLALLMLLGPDFAQAADNACPFPGQTRMLQVQMFFGQDENGKPIPASAWETFLETAVRPRFSGFTVCEGDGRWVELQTHAVTREKAKILQINEADTSEVRDKVSELSRLYRER